MNQRISIYWYTKCIEISLSCISDTPCMQLYRSSCIYAVVPYIQSIILQYLILLNAYKMDFFTNFHIVKTGVTKLVLGTHRLDLHHGTRRYLWTKPYQSAWSQTSRCIL